MPTPCHPTQTHYRDLRRTAERTGDWPALRREAITRLRDAAATHAAVADHLVAVLLEEGEPDDAWRAAIDHRDDLPDSRWQQLIDLRQHTHPAEMVEPLQRLIEKQLSTSTDKHRYDRVTRMVKQLRTAYRSSGDTAALRDFMDELRDRHRRKTAFLAKLDRAQL
ncbi:hypothetical protein [Pseudonocardia nigra]|uniref:hypothetical protein n=1 Tax=Pseudonocardia nigra TaxID=1921578 RepID=UPI001C5D56F0|nr:hypothetical protein [Pseudonocardia nigra]